MLLATGSFTLVYILGTAAAVHVLPPGGWARRGAAVAFAAVAVLLVLTGWYVLWTLVVVAYHGWRQRWSDARGRDDRRQAEPLAVLGVTRSSPTP
jgi:amino acid efflux transporter